MVSYVLGIAGFLDGFIKGQKARVEAERWHLMNEYYRMLMTKMGWDMNTHTFNGANAANGVLKNGMEETYRRDPYHLRGGGGAGEGGGTAETGGHYSVAQMVKMAQKAGFKGDDAAHIAAIAAAESNGNPNAVGPAGEVGLTQINPHAWSREDVAEARDPQGAFNIAYKVYQQQGWGAWSTDPSSKNFTPHNSMEKFYGTARSALGKEAAPTTTTAAEPAKAEPVKAEPTKAAVKPGGKVSVTAKEAPIKAGWENIVGKDTPEAAAYKRAHPDWMKQYEAGKPPITTTATDASAGPQAQAQPFAPYQVAGPWEPPPAPDPAQAGAGTPPPVVPRAPQARPAEIPAGEEGYWRQKVAGERAGIDPGAGTGVTRPDMPARPQPTVVSEPPGTNFVRPQPAVPGVPTVSEPPGTNFVRPTGIPAGPGQKPQEQPKETVKPEEKGKEKEKAKGEEKGKEKAKAPTIDSQQRPYLMAEPGQRAVGVGRSPLTTDPFWRPNPPTAERKGTAQPNTGLPTQPGATQPVVHRPVTPTQQPGPTDPSIIAKQKQMGIDPTVTVSAPSPAVGGGGGGGGATPSVQEMQNQLAMMERMMPPSSSDSSSPAGIQVIDQSQTVSPPIMPMVAADMPGAAQAGGFSPYGQSPQQPIDFISGLPRQQDVGDIIASRKGGIVWKAQTGGYTPTSPTAYGTNPLASFSTGMSNTPASTTSGATPNYMGVPGATPIPWGSPAYYANMPGANTSLPAGQQTQDPWTAAGMTNRVWSSPADIPQQYIPPGETAYWVFQNQPALQAERGVTDWSSYYNAQPPTIYQSTPPTTPTPAAAPAPTPTPPAAPNVTTTSTATDPFLQSLEAQNATAQQKWQDALATQQAKSVQAATTANTPTTTPQPYTPPPTYGAPITPQTTSTTSTPSTGDIATASPLLRSYAGFQEGGDVSPATIGPPPALGSAMGQGTPVPPYYYNTYTYPPKAAPVGKGVSQTSVGTILPSAAVPTYQEGGDVQPSDPAATWDMTSQGYPGLVGPNYGGQPSMSGMPGITSRGGISMRGLMYGGGGGRGFMGLDIPMPPEFGPNGEYRKPEGAPPHASAISDHDGNPSPDIISAIQGGIKSLMQTFGLQPNQGMPDQQQQQNRQVFQRTKSSDFGVTPEHIEAIGDTIDPMHQLDYGTRYLGGLGALYKYYAYRGEWETADRVAAGMLMYARDLAQAYGEQAWQALSRGDTQTAAQLEAMGFSAIPSGIKYDVKNQPNSDGTITVSAWNMANKQLWQQHVAPEMIIAGAMGLRDGVAFWRELQGSAGRYNPMEAEQLKEELQHQKEMEGAGALEGFAEQIKGGPRSPTTDSQPSTAQGVVWPSVQMGLPSNQPQRVTPPASVVPRATPVTGPAQPGTLAAPPTPSQNEQTGLPPLNQMAGDINPLQALPSQQGAPTAGAGQGTAQTPAPPPGAEARGGVFGRTSPAYQGIATTPDVTPAQEMDYYSRIRELAHSQNFTAQGDPIIGGQPVYRPNEPDWVRVPRAYLPQVRQMYADESRKYEDARRDAEMNEQRMYESHRADIAGQVATQRQRASQAEIDYRQLQSQRYGAAKTMQQHQWDVQKQEEAARIAHDRALELKAVEAGKLRSDEETNKLIAGETGPNAGNNTELTRLAQVLPDGDTTKDNASAVTALNKAGFTSTMQRGLAGIYNSAIRHGNDPQEAAIAIMTLAHGARARGTEVGEADTRVYGSRFNIPVQLDDGTTVTVKLPREAANNLALIGNQWMEHKVASTTKPIDQYQDWIRSQGISPPSQPATVGLPSLQPQSIKPMPYGPMLRPTPWVPPSQVPPEVRQQFPELNQ